MKSQGRSPKRKLNNDAHAYSTSPVKSLPLPLLLSVLNMVALDQVQEKLNSTHTCMQTAGPSFVSDNVHTDSLHQSTPAWKRSWIMFSTATPSSIHHDGNSIQIALFCDISLSSSMKIIWGVPSCVIYKHARHPFLAFILPSD